MIKLIKEKVIKENKYIHYSLLWIFRYMPRIIVFNLLRLLRICGIYSGHNFKRIKKFKDKHKGERCFIVATGPSLKVEDLEKIKHEFTFSMNSIVLSFEDTEWRPTYYGIQDSRAYEKLKGAIFSANMPYTFCGISSKKLSPQMSGDFIAYPLNLLNHNGIHLKHYTKFSDDAFSVIYDGFTITYSLMQLAVYMGFKEIYLLGVDCNYTEKGKNYLKDYITQTDFNAGFLMAQSYKVAQEYAEKNGIKIYNASRGGKLEVFERVNFDELTFLKGNTNENNVNYH
ncbi:6-hydroxymethylpterin diphosphokinase MptE-like protein [Bacillus thuringiensis]